MFRCSFCMINVVNRNDNERVGVASNYSGMRFWSPELIIKEIDKLVAMGVKTLKISDEMFLLNRKYYVPLCNMIKERGYGKFLNMWAYSRIDTIKRPENLKLVREAGIRWLCLGIESGDIKVRLEASKGKFKDVDINHIIDMMKLLLDASSLSDEQKASFNSMKEYIDEIRDLNGKYKDSYTNDPNWIYKTKETVKSEVQNKMAGGMSEEIKSENDLSGINMITGR